MARRRKGGPSSFCRQRRSVRKQTGRAPLLVCHGFSNISRRDQGPVQRFHFHCKQAANCRVILVAALQRLSISDAKGRMTSAGSAEAPKNPVGSGLTLPDNPGTTTTTPKLPELCAPLPEPRPSRHWVVRMSLKQYLQMYA